jgi:hypothetical protein
MNINLATSQPPNVVALLGYGGLLPFLVALSAIAMDPVHGVVWLALQQAYGAVILSFVGALHWGIAMTSVQLSDSQRTRAYLWSVVPALLAWPALMVTGLLASGLLVVGFTLHYFQDSRLVTKVELPAWYLPLRGRLTAFGCISLIVGALFA